MKLMPTQSPASASPQTIARKFSFRIAEQLSARAHARPCGQQAQQRIPRAVERLNPLREIHQPAALGVNNTLFCGKLPDRIHHSSVGGKRLRILLGIPATNVNTMQITRQRGIPQRREINQLTTRTLQSLEIVWIVKVERLVPRNA